MQNLLQRRLLLPLPLVNAAAGTGCRYTAAAHPRLVKQKIARWRDMPYIGSSGAKFHLDGPASRTPPPSRTLAYLTIGAALLLSFVALIRLGAAASAAVAAVSSALPASSLGAPSQLRNTTSG